MNDFKYILDPEDVKRLDRISARFPKLVVRQWAGVARQISNIMRKTLASGGGRNGVPVWAPRHHITLQLGKRVWGGMLSNTITNWGNPFQGGQYWGFPSGVREWFGEDLQTAEERPFSRAERGYLRRRLNIKNPGVYTRPERPFLKPFSDDIPTIIREEFFPRVMKALNKELKK